MIANLLKMKYVTAKVISQEIQKVKMLKTFIFRYDHKHNYIKTILQYILKCLNLHLLKSCQKVLFPQVLYKHY